MQLGPVSGREVHVGQHIGLGFVHEVASFGSLGRSWSATLRHCALAASAGARDWPNTGVCLGQEMGWQTTPTSQTCHTFADTAAGST